MKILHLLDEPWDSGVTAYAVQVAVLLKKNGHAVTLGVRAGKIPEALARSQGLETISIESFFDLKKLLASQSFDVVNAHTGATHTWAVLNRILPFQKNKFPALLRTRGDARPLSTTFLNRFVYQNTDGVIAASEHILKQYEAGLGWGEPRVRVVYPSIEVEKNSETIPHNVVGILGRLDPVKGHAFFLEAASLVLAKNNQVRFLLAGKEANLSRSLLENQSKELKIEHAVEYLGFQPSATEFMKRCSLGVISSIGSEEVSRACLEWMSVGRPVVGTLVGCLPELIETEETGSLVPPEDSSALAAAILKLLENPELIQKWGARAKEVSAKRFGPQVQLEKTIEAYNWALAHRCA